MEYFLRGNCCLAKTKFWGGTVFSSANWQFAWFPYLIWVYQQIINIRQFPILQIGSNQVDDHTLLFILDIYSIKTETVSDHTNV